MNYNALYAKSFQYGMMFGKDIEPGQPVSISVTNVDDILLAVKKAYVDMSPRTLKSNNEENKQSIDSEMKDCLFLDLAKKIADYMQCGAENFDMWHKDTCLFFVTRFAEILKSADKKAEGATYGKAQKIVNMTFKYLYCFDDAKEYIHRFEPCHMALDSYILNWVNDWFIEKYNQGKPKKEWLSKNGTRQLPKWSSLKYEAEEGDVPQYIDIQNAIKHRLDRPRIEAEFEIWYNERKKAEEKAKKK